MITFAPYQPEHLRQLDVASPAQRQWMARYAEPGYAERLAQSKWAASGFINDQVVGCAGIIAAGHIGVSWSIFGNIPRPEWVSVVKHMRGMLKQAHAAGLCRITATVPVGFGPGCRLAKALGFDVEGVMRAAGTARDDLFMYARVR
jgi:hypothetical protein